MGVFENDYSLPPLPVPTLGETCALLKQAVKPLLEPPAWEKACIGFDRFSESGAALQELLERYAGSKAHNASWLRPLWDDMYLSYRGALPINMNYAFEFMGEQWGSDALPQFIAAMCLTVNNLRTEALAPESAKTGFFSMDTLQHAIYTRIPCAVRDVWVHPSLAALASVAVVCKGHWFILTAVNEKGGLLSPAAIAAGIRKIRECAGAMGQAVPVGSVTAAERVQAASLRDELQQSISNRMNFESIEKCLFAVCLDETGSEGGHFGYNMIGGDCQNRWFDKSLQIISTTDGRIGVNLEHSGCDAGMWVYLFNQTDAAIRERKLPEGEGAAHIRPLTWTVSGSAAGQLEGLREEFTRKMKTVTICQKRVTTLTKDRIKALKCSPDAFVQMLFQAAYYKEKRCFRSVYEAVSTRAFYQGRTECVRPVTEESAAFIKAFCKGGDMKPLQEKFRLAEKAHADGVARRQKAMGPERHMSGLYQMYAMFKDREGLQFPDIFESEGYRTLRYDAVSTSSTTAPYIDYFGFGPVVADGLGVGYGLKSDALHMMVSSYVESGIPAGTFIENIEEAAEKLLGVLG